MGKVKKNHYIGGYGKEKKLNITSEKKRKQIQNEIDHVSEKLEEEKGEKLTIDQHIARITAELDPREDRVIIFPDDLPQKTSGGLFLPPSPIAKPSTGTIVGVGPGVKSDNGWLALIFHLLLWVVKVNVIKKDALLPDRFNKVFSPMEDIEPGDRCVYGRFAGTEVEWKGELYVVVRQSDIMLREKRKMSIEELENSQPNTSLP